MYTELELIDNIQDKQTKLELLLLFIEEYGGWKTHIENVGKKWGAGGEEVRAENEMVKCRQHIDKLKSRVIELIA